MESFCVSEKTVADCRHCCVAQELISHIIVVKNDYISRERVWWVAERDFTEMSVNEYPLHHLGIRKCLVPGW